MKIDRRILYLLSIPIVSILLCFLAYIVLPDQKTFIPERPVFLAYVDQLSTYSQRTMQKDTPQSIRDVFHHESVDQTPITVSMIVKNGPRGYSIINGKRMETGDSTDFFTLLSIDNDSVKIVYNNGAEETVHVKTY
ncbi:MAG TPA: hypothetical protein ENN05_02525 [Deltaproteobacteria bacterium]|nr:hypothetical protein [Deltaproteobacteria bacterium]